MKMQICKALLVITIACAGLTFAGCGSGVSGKYQDATGAITAEFISGGKVNINMMGLQVQGTYTVSGDKLTIVGPDKQTLVLTINSDGSLTGDSGNPLGKLTKVK